MNAAAVTIALVVGAVGVAAWLSYRAAKRGVELKNLKREVRNDEKADQARRDYDTDPEFRDRLHDRFRR